MLIDRICKKVKTFLNTDVRGNFDPTDFNLFLHNAIQERNEDIFPEITRLVNRENKGLVSNSLENTPDKYREKLLHYHKTSVLAADRELPSDLRYIDSLEFADGTFLEFTKDSREFNIVKTIATLQYPIYTKSGSFIKIAPTYDGVVTISYLRKVKYPKWTYTKFEGVELFDPSKPDFQDADIHPSEEDEMVRRVLLGFGVNLKEEDIQAFTMNEAREDFKNENTN